MGSIIGGIIGGIGDIVAGNKAGNAAYAGATKALTGYNYLTSDPTMQAAESNGQTAIGGEASTVGAENQLLTSPDQNNPAFKNYLNSTGYNFQLQQGENAVTGSAAAKGILNSGATAKALTGYGQNLASTSFNNYLGQLGSVNNQYAGQAAQGLGAAQVTGQAGTQGGIAAGQLTAEGGQAKANGIAGAFGQASNIFGSAGTNGLSNAFSFLGG